MSYAIIFSGLDKAGMSIRDAFFSKLKTRATGIFFEGSQVYTCPGAGQEIRLYTIEGDTVHANNIDKKLPEDILIFATRHKSESGKPSLSLHAPGNWGPADFGGHERQLCPAPALLMKSCFAALASLGRDSDYAVTLECTHHGPYVEKPAMFIEVGSSEAQWSDAEAGAIIATAIMRGIANAPREGKCAIAMGGPHYMPNFKETVLESDYAIGHCCPKHMLGMIDEELLRQAIAKTNPSPECIIADWKGLGQEKRRVLSLAEKAGLPVQRTKGLNSTL